MRQSKCEVCADTLTHSHTIQLPRVGVQLVGNTSKSILYGHLDRSTEIIVRLFLGDALPIP